MCPQVFHCFQARSDFLSLQCTFSDLKKKFVGTRACPCYSWETPSALLPSTPPAGRKLLADKSSPLLFRFLHPPKSACPGLSFWPYVCTIPAPGWCIIIPCLRTTKPPCLHPGTQLLGPCYLKQANLPIYLLYAYICVTEREKPIILVPKFWRDPQPHHQHIVWGPLPHSLPPPFPFPSYSPDSG